MEISKKHKITNTRSCNPLCAVRSASKSISRPTKQTRLQSNAWTVVSA